MSVTTRTPRYAFGRLVLDYTAADTINLWELMLLNKHYNLLPDRMAYIYNNCCFIFEKHGDYAFIFSNSSPP